MHALSRSRALAMLVASLALAACGHAEARRADEIPALLSGTGLYADITTKALAPGVLPYTPRYPLWTDGATKRRWISLPPGTAIDGTQADAWTFPAGTRLWKEFAFGRRVETRFLARRADGSWLFAAYVWNEDETEARLAPERGLPGVREIAPGIRHDVPSRLDCLACHERPGDPVLGFAAWQLAPERDPLAPHAEDPHVGDVDLPALVARGLIRHGAGPVPATADPPIPAPTPRARAALGYLRANCGACHDGRGRMPSLTDLLREASPDASRPWLRRMQSRSPLDQMPPLGTRIVDVEAISLLEAWLEEDTASSRPAAPTLPSLESLR